MKAAWLEDLLSLIPPISFLVGSRVAHRKPSAEYPYGYHRAVTVAYLVGSVALLFMGTWLFVKSVLKLVRAEYPSIGTTQLFGHTVWMGWLMLAALLWSAIPSVLLGWAKLPLAESLHDKVLHADALMNKADWLTAVAAMLGVLGIGMGWWWADAVAAGVIALDIAWDGQRHLRTALGDLMDRTPRTLDSKHAEPLPRRIHEALCGLDWVEAAQVRVREERTRLLRGRAPGAEGAGSGDRSSSPGWATPPRTSSAWTGACATCCWYRWTGSADPGPTGHRQRASTHAAPPWLVPGGLKISSQGHGGGRQPLPGGTASRQGAGVGYGWDMAWMTGRALPSSAVMETTGRWKQPSNSFRRDSAVTVWSSAGRRVTVSGSKPRTRAVSSAFTQASELMKETAWDASIPLRARSSACSGTSFPKDARSWVTVLMPSPMRCASTAPSSTRWAAPPRPSQGRAEKPYVAPRRERISPEA